MVNFELTESQEETLKLWQNEIKKEFGTYGHYDYIFTPFGMGNGVKVRSHLNNTTLDLSQVENW